jgi:hypothetical protein
MAGIAVFGERFGVPALSLLVLIATIVDNPGVAESANTWLGKPSGELWCWSQRGLG